MDDNLGGEGKKKFADGDEILKWAVIAEYNLHRKDINSRLEDGYRQLICDRFNICSTTLHRYVREWETQRELNIIPDLSVKKVQNCGVGNSMLTDELTDCIFELAYEMQGSFTYEGFTKRFNEHYIIQPPISTPTMFRWFKKLEAVQTMSYIKPHLLFFNSLQKRSFELRSKCHSPQELMETVQQAWAQYDWQTLERGWGHLFATYRAILDAEGTNQYQRPHSGVGMRQLAGAGTLDPYVSMDSYLTGMEARDTLVNAD